MSEPKAAGSRAHSVYRALRRAIIEQALKPGMKLPEDSIGEQLGVSRTLVREAFNRLAVEGLVELKPNRGASVAYPTLEEARDVEARLGLDDLPQPLLGPRLDRARTRLARLGRRVDRARQRDDVPALLGGLGQRLLVPRALAEHRVEPERQEPGDHGEKNDVQHARFLRFRIGT